MSVFAVPHPNAWRLVTDRFSDDYGVLVQMGRPPRPYLYLLCPAAATLYLTEPFDLTDCSDATCEHDDIHRAAVNLWQLICDERANAALLAQMARQAADRATRGDMTGEPTGLAQQLIRDGSVAPVDAPPGLAVMDRLTALAGVPPVVDVVDDGDRRYRYADGTADPEA